MSNQADKKSRRSTFAGYALSFLYPQRCAYCGRVIDLRLTVCPQCADALQEIKGEVCLLCGCMKADCSCEGKKSYYRAVAAPFYYSGSAGNLIRRFKFQNEPQLGKQLAAKMAETLSEVYGDVHFDAVIPVPMYRDKLAERGYNQAEILAKELAGLTGIPFLPALEKSCDTKPQHTLPHDARTANLLGAFTCGENGFSGKTLLLTDDIKTTGSTLNECAKTLLIGGAQSVYCLCAAIVKAKENDGADNTDG